MGKDPGKGVIVKDRLCGRSDEVACLRASQKSVVPCFSQVRLP